MLMLMNTDSVLIGLAAERGGEGSIQSILFPNQEAEARRDCTYGNADKPEMNTKVLICEDCEHGASLDCTLSPLIIGLNSQLSVQGGEDMDNCAQCQGCMGVCVCVCIHLPVCWPCFRYCFASAGVIV